MDFFSIDTLIGAISMAILIRFTDLYHTRQTRMMVRDIYLHILKNKQLPTGMHKLADILANTECGVPDEDEEEENIEE